MKTAIKVAAMLSFAVAMLQGAWGGGYVYDRDYMQDMYNGFGDLIDRNMKIAYEFSAENSTVDDEVGFNLLKSSSAFWRRFKGAIVFSETPVAKMQVDVVFREKYKRLEWSPQVLQNNLLDGIFISLRIPKAVNFELINAYPYDFINGPANDVMRSERLGWGSGDYTALRDEPSMTLMQGVLASVDSQIFPSLTGVNNKSLTFFRIRTLEGMGLTVNHQSTGASTPFYKGSYELESIPSEGVDTFYVRVVCLNQHDPDAFAAVYGAISRVPGVDVRIIETPVNSAVGADGRLYYKVTANDYAVFEVHSTVGATNEMTVYVDVAGTYAIQVSPQAKFPDYDGNDALQSVPLNTVAYSSKKGLGNRNVIEVPFGVPTANNFAGLKADLTFLTFDLRLAIFNNRRFYQFPGTNGLYNSLDAMSVDVGVDKSIGPVEINFHYFYTEPSYETRFLVYTGDYSELNSEIHYNVLDNDNNDFMSPIYNGYYWEADEEFEGQGVDKNRNNVVDYEEDFLLITEDHHFFKMGADLNNNEVPDDIEDDEKLDYVSPPGMRGMRGTVGYKVDVGKGTLKVSGFGVLDKLEAQSLSNTTFGARINYEYVDKRSLIIRSQYEFKRVIDSIPDDVVTAESVAGDDSAGLDPLYYRNSLVNSFTASVALKGVKDLEAEIIPVLKYNLRFMSNASMRDYYALKDLVYDDTDKIEEIKADYLADENYIAYSNLSAMAQGVSNEGEEFFPAHILQSGITARAMYTFDFATINKKIKGLTLTPMFKYVFNNVSTIPSLDTFDNMRVSTTAGVLKLQYKMLETFEIMTGGQYRVDQDLLNWQNNMQSGTFLAELTMRARRLAMVTGYKFTSYKFIRSFSETTSDSFIGNYDSSFNYNESQVYVVVLYKMK